MIDNSGGFSYNTILCSTDRRGLSGQTIQWEDKPMKRTPKAVFFIVALLIFGLAYTSIFGVYTYYGDRQDTIIRGADNIRLGMDIKGGVDATFGPAEDVGDITSKQVDDVREVIEQRLVLQGITDYEVYSDQTNHSVIVRFPWASDEADYDPAAAIEELGRTAQLEFHIGKAYETVEDEEGNEIQKPTGELILTGDDVDSATVMFDQETGEPVIQLELKASGTDKFSDATAKQYAVYQADKSKDATISIWLDNEMISAPTVEAHITDGVATISGGFADASEAYTTANLINSGALPFNIEVKSFGTVPPTLGEKALDAMILAGIIAFILVSVYILLYYRLSGFVAVIALVGQVAASLAAISGYFGFFNGFTLTLPGIAGIILGIGMGVDANVITSERIKEEIRAGKTIDGAINVGSKNSFSAIFDGNVTVAIVAIILMGVFGPPDNLCALILKPFLFMFPPATTGTVYSFGYTLFVGIIFNFVFGVLASRLMLKSITRFKCLRKPWLLGGERA